MVNLKEPERVYLLQKLFWSDETILKLIVLIKKKKHTHKNKKPRWVQ